MLCLYQKAKVKIERKTLHYRVTIVCTQKSRLLTICDNLPGKCQPKQKQFKTKVIEHVEIHTHMIMLKKGFSFMYMK